MIEPPANNRNHSFSHNLPGAFTFKPRYHRHKGLYQHLHHNEHQKKQKSNNKNNHNHNHNHNNNNNNNNNNIIISEDILVWISRIYEHSLSINSRLKNSSHQRIVLLENIHSPGQETLSKSSSTNASIACCLCFSSCSCFGLQLTTHSPYNAKSVQR